MQKINLLPPELRPKDTTPAKVIVTIYAGVAVTFSLLMWALYLIFGVIPPKENEVLVINNQIKSLQSTVNEYDRIERLIKELEAKDKIVTDIKNQRILWAKKLDSLWTSISDTDTTWLDSYMISTTKKVVVKNRKKIPVAIPKLTVDMKSGRFNVKENQVDQKNDESLIQEFIAQLHSNEDLMRGFRLIRPKSYKFDDKEYEDEKLLFLDYELVFEALPYDSDAGVRRKEVSKK